VKLVRAVSRFQLSDGLRSALLALLPQVAPWTQSVPPAEVASLLESFLVEEVPANPPDYNLLRGLGADCVLELVVEDYGMRSENGRAHAFLKGHARLFRIGQPDLWERHFERSLVGATNPILDPFEVAKDGELFRDAMGGLIESVAEELAESLRTPGLPEPAAPVPPPPAPPPEPSHQPLPEDDL
jgi:hypothetical protein